MAAPSKLTFLQRLRVAWHYAANPGGRTHRHASIRRTKDETTRMLRREVTERRLVAAVARELGLP